MARPPGSSHNGNESEPRPDHALSTPTQTTIMAASFPGGVVLGADSRTSTGDYIANRVTDKLTPLARNVYICRSGSAADTQNLSRYVSWFLEQHEMDLGTPPRVETAAKLAQQMAYQNKNVLQAGLIIAGWDSVEQGAIYAVPLGGTLVKTPFSIGGSGSAYISGLCDKLWKVCGRVRKSGEGMGDGQGLCGGIFMRRRTGLPVHAHADFPFVARFGLWARCTHC